MTNILQGLQTVLINQMAPLVAPVGQLTEIVVAPIGSTQDLAEAIRQLQGGAALPIGILSMGGNGSFGDREGKVANLAAQCDAGWSYVFAMVFSDFKQQSEYEQEIYRSIESFLTVMSDMALEKENVAPGWTAYRVALSTATSFRFTDSQIYGVLFTFTVQAKRRILPINLRH